MKRCGQAAADAEREAAILRVPAWQGASPLCCPVGGGTSNWRVSAGGGGCFVRVPGEGAELFIDRAAAVDASRGAHAPGAGPAVFGWLAADGIEIAGFVTGRRACTHADFQDPTICRSAVAAFQRLHQGPPLAPVNLENPL